MGEYSALVAILKRGKASKVLSTLKQKGVRGGTIVYGKGTARNELLKFIDYNHIHKEVLISVISCQDEDQLLEVLNERYHFDRPNSGIVFTIGLNEVVSTKRMNTKDKEKESSNMDYELIYVVVDNHRGEKVVEVAGKYGAKGATIIHGRGSGIHEKGSIFNLTIEPEKEVVMMLVQTEYHDDIVSGIISELEIEKPGNGILFTMGINQAIGLVE